MGEWPVERDPPQDDTERLRQQIERLRRTRAAISDRLARRAVEELIAESEAELCRLTDPPEAA